MGNEKKGGMPINMLTGRNIVFALIVLSFAGGVLGLALMLSSPETPATTTTSTGEKIPVISVAGTKCDTDRTVDLSLAMQNSKNASYQQYLVGTVDIYQGNSYKKQLTTVNGSGTLVYNSTGSQSSWCDSDLVLRVNTGNTVNSMIDYAIVSEDTCG
jgi:hypothetical protein